MFLGKLSQDEQTAFMKLASIIVKSDLNITESEEKLFSEYESEMGRTFGDLIKQDFNLDEVLTSTENIDVIKKRIIFFELLGLALCDNSFEDMEQKVIEKIRVKLDINIEMQNAMLSTINKLMKAYVEIGEYFEQ
jgi:uncharacterized tellurite resistance protein B-like protein